MHPKGVYLMKSIQTIVTRLLIAGLMIGCTPPTDTSSKQTSKSSTEYKHGTKIVTQYIPDKNETNIYQKEFKIQPKLFVGRKIVEGEHSFEIDNMASYSGRKPSAVPTNLTFILLHSTPEPEGWHYPKNAAFVFIADGVRVEMPVSRQFELKKDDPSDAEYWESIIISSTYDMYSKIGNAKNVEFQVGTGRFKLRDEDIAAFRDFLSYITPEIARK